MDTVTDDDILAMEQQFWKTQAAKEDQIRAAGLSPVRYYQRLNRLLDDPGILPDHPQAVYRLRRLRDARRP